MKKGITLIFIGVFFLICENLFYQRIDENGFLHESLFLPLGTFLVIIGLFYAIYKNIKDRK